jgi:CHAT domain-containing protein/tetratricopeptide (TPR) repeat protein
MQTEDQRPNGQIHLSNDLVRRIACEVDADSALPDAELADARRHIQNCELCSLRLDVERRGGWSSGETALGGCPEETLWYAVVAGTAREDEARSMLQHASQCASCASRLQDAVCDLQDDLSPHEESAIGQLSVSRAAWPREFARRLQLESTLSARPSKRPWWNWKLLTAVAAACVVLAITWAAYSILASRAQRQKHEMAAQRQSEIGRVDAMLALAYQTHRNTEFRLPGTEPAPMAPVERNASGQLSNLPPDLLDAMAIAKRDVAADEASSPWRDLEGRSELMAGEFDAAIATLENATKLPHASPAAFNDLAAAYATRATRDVTRAERDRQADLRTAYEITIGVLKTDKNDPVALYNKALLEVRLNLPGEAIRTLEDFLNTDKNSPWSQDARELKKKLEKQQSIRLQNAPSVSPAAFLRQHGDSETYLETAVRQWLPHSQDPQVHQALETLARELIEHHQDYWLRDTLAQTVDVSAFQSLADAVDDSARADYSAALHDSEVAIQRFQQAGATAALLRAQFEKVYAQRRMIDGESCSAAAQQLLQALGPLSFPYLQAQAWIEASSCQGFRGEYGQSIRGADKAIVVAKQAQLRIVGLRALGMRASFENDYGNVDQAWNLCVKVLQDYWAKWAPPMRAFHCLVEMENVAEEDSQWELAKSLQREAISTIDSDEDEDLKAIAHLRFARLLVMTGDRATADLEIGNAAKLFQQAPDLETARLHEADSLILLAATQVKLGDIGQARETLARARVFVRDLRSKPNYLQVSVLAVQADLARASQRWPEAEKSYNTAVGIAETSLRSLQRPSERSHWSASHEALYRGLVSMLIRRGDIEGAWALWQAYCGTAFPGGPRVPDSYRSARLPRSHDIVRLTYLSLDDGLAVWSSAPTGHSFHLVPVNHRELADDSRRLLTLCSRRDTDPEQVHGLARKLYGNFISPVLNGIGDAGSLLVQPDTALADFPFEVLEDENGQSLGRKHAVMYSPGVDYDHDIHSGVGQDFAAVLLVGAISGPEGLLPGSEDEIRAFYRSYPRTTSLSGQGETADSLISKLRSAQVLEFIGHGQESFEGAGLVVRRDQSAGTSLVLDAGLLETAELSQLKLAVLSACSTAYGRHGLLDPESLVQSFLRGGTQMVVASRWDVDSLTTSQLMTLFYQQLSQGVNVPEALARASNQLRQQGPDRPFYWAAFSVYE